VPKAPPKDYYASVMFPGSKKLSIVSKRVGTKERLHAIATVTNETVADKIVEALNVYQGGMDELTASTAGVISDLRGSLKSERAIISGLKTENNSLKLEIQRLKNDLADATRRHTQEQLAARQREAAYQG
jgi:hypothetical protein